MNRAYDQAVALELAQLLDQHLLRDRRDRALELGEPQRTAAEQVKQDHQLPAAVEHPDRRLELPAPIAAYFAHEAADPQAVAQCLAEDAIVSDEQHERRGRPAIAAWSASTIAKYAITTRPLAAATDGAHTEVRARVDGTFPGAPIQLRFRFTLAHDLIARLEIRS